LQYRIFEDVINALPADGSEDLQLVLAASKCLDLLFVLQTEEFQVSVLLCGVAFTVADSPADTNGYSSPIPLTLFTALKTGPQKPCSTNWQRLRAACHW